MSVDSTAERILEAALQTMLSFGIRRSTVDAVARRAGVSHMTVYRRWPTKNDLLLAVLTREYEAAFAAIDRDIAALTNSADRLVAGFTGIYWHAHTHPLLTRTLETDPESVLPAITTGAGPALDLATAYLARHITRSADNAGATIEDPYGVAEIFVRLTHSLLLVPRTKNPLITRADAEQYARQYILPIARASIRPSAEAPH
jgi:AcrR family transcriptional regulator